MKSWVSNLVCHVATRNSTFYNLTITYTDLHEMWMYIKLYFWQTSIEKTPKKSSQNFDNRIFFSRLWVNDIIITLIFWSFANSLTFEIKSLFSTISNISLSIYIMKFYLTFFFVINYIISIRHYYDTHHLAGKKNQI